MRGPLATPQSARIDCLLQAGLLQPGRRLEAVAGLPPGGLQVGGEDCRIRVTPATLKKCGLEGENFAIDGGDGKIVVRPAKEGNVSCP